MRSRRRLTWLLRIVLAGLGMAAVVALWPPARVAVQTAVFLPSLFSASPFQPLLWFTHSPSRAEDVFTYAGGRVDLDVYHPQGGAPRKGGMVLMLGALPLPRRDPLVENLAESLARIGIVVAVPESSGLKAGRVTPDEIAALRETVSRLVAEPDVLPDRVGVVGLSVGAGLAIAGAATDPFLRAHVQFVNALGGYYGVEGLLIDTASRTILVRGTLVPWEPDPRTLHVLATSLQGAVPDEEVLIRRLVEGMSRGDAEELVAHLPESLRQELRQVSPSTYVDRLQARVYLMHDTGDTLIPFTESRHLAATAPTVRRHTEFSIFEHVVPDRPVSMETFVPDVWAMYWHVHAVLLEVL